MFKIHRTDLRLHPKSFPFSTYGWWFFSGLSYLEFGNILGEILHYKLEVHLAHWEGVGNLGFTFYVFFFPLPFSLASSPTLWKCYTKSPEILMLYSMCVNQKLFEAWSSETCKTLEMFKMWPGFHFISSPLRNNKLRVFKSNYINQPHFFLSKLSRISEVHYYHYYIWCPLI